MIEKRQIQEVFWQPESLGAPPRQLQLICKLTVAIHKIIQGVADISKTTVGFVAKRTWPQQDYALDSWDRPEGHIPPRLEKPEAT